MTLVTLNTIIWTILLLHFFGQNLITGLKSFGFEMLLSYKDHLA